jgi:phospholipid N-methyltransferase
MNLLKDYFEQISSKIITKSYSENEWMLKNFALQKVHLKNIKLAQSFEKLCNEKNEILTFGEFITEEMYGKNGYYNTHIDFGKTGIEKVWSNAIINICEENSIHSILEIGSGDGSLGIETLKIAKKNNISFKWTGIEVNNNLVNQLRKTLQKIKIDNFLVFNSLKNVSFDKYLVIFPYSLDSMANEVMVNIQNKKSNINSLLGIKVKNNYLEETLLTKDNLNKRNISFKNNIFTGANEHSLDFSSWKLKPFQRAYLPIKGFLNILETIEKINKDSMFLIIDEIKPPPNLERISHLGTPRVLNHPKRDYSSIEGAYHNIGNNLWYFPFYLKPLINFLKQLGFYDVNFDVEDKLAAFLGKNKWNKPGLYLRCAIIAKYKIISNKKSFSLTSPFEQ